MLYLMPDSFDEYREPFVGGGSFFILLRQKYPGVKMWINDLNTELFCFWKCAQEDSVRLAREVMRIKEERADGRGLFYELLGMDTSKMSEFERVVRFFVLNRIIFSEVVDAGGYSEGSFIGRFTRSSIERLALLGEILEGVRITNSDYKDLLQDGDQVIKGFSPSWTRLTLQQQNQGCMGRTACPTKSSIISSLLNR